MIWKQKIWPVEGTFTNLSAESFEFYGIGILIYSLYMNRDVDMDVSITPVEVLLSSLSFGGGCSVLLQGQ